MVLEHLCFPFLRSPSAKTENEKRGCTMLPQAKTPVRSLKQAKAQQGVIVNILIEAPGGPALPVEQADAELLARLLSQPDRRKTKDDTQSPLLIANPKSQIPNRQEQRPCPAHQHRSCA
jgi:hypothetical protein